MWVGALRLASFGLEGLLRHGREVGGELVFGKESVVVGVDGFKLLLHTIGGFGFDDLAVLVGVPFVEHVFGAVVGAHLTGAKFGGGELAIPVFVE